mgnify:CR=1 FL=1
MGVTVSVNGTSVESISYTIRESSTPVTGGDSSGAVSTFDVVLPATAVSPLTLHRASVQVTDPQYGTIFGEADSVKLSRDGHTRTISCVSTTGHLSVFNVVADAFSGTLTQALSYYIRLGHPTVKWSIPSAIGNRAVAYIGWRGDLWYRLKQIAIAQDLEVVLIGDTVTFRTPRSVTLPFQNYGSADLDVGDGDPAERAEMYWYRTSAVSNASVYPPYRDLESPQIHSVPAGEETEIMLQLSVSLKSIDQPVYRETITPDWFEGSAISLYTDSGSRISHAEWDRGGGSVRAEIQDDASQVKLIIRGPTYAEGGFLRGGSLRLAVPAGKSNLEYTSIRLRGTGVQFQKELIEVPTGIPKGLASSETTPTDDNPFMTSPGRAYELCTSLAAASGARLTAQYSGPTLGIPNGLGIAAGGRFYDSQAGQWFRSRQNNYTREGVSVSGDLDTTHADMASVYEGLTYAQVQALHAGQTYDQVRLKGLNL